MTARAPAPVVLVVAKAPVPGEVKTRLIPAFGPDNAAELAAAALLDTLDAVAEAADELGTHPAVAWLGDVRRAVCHRDLQAALGGFRVVQQRGDGFAERLVRAHADAAGDRPVVQIGMDTPQIGAADLLAAARSLDRTPAALGPAADGGWWLLALRNGLLAAPLAGVPMSLPDTGARTQAALQAAGLAVTTLPEARDVDTLADAFAVAAQAPTTRFGALVEALCGSSPPTPPATGHQPPVPSGSPERR